LKQGDVYPLMKVTMMKLIRKQQSSQMVDLTLEENGNYSFDSLLLRLRLLQPAEDAVQETKRQDEHRQVQGPSRTDEVVDHDEAGSAFQSQHLDDRQQQQPRHWQLEQEDQASPQQQQHLDYHSHWALTVSACATKYTGRQTAYRLQQLTGVSTMNTRLWRCCWMAVEAESIWSKRWSEE
jgi:hypothetical protein